MKRNKNSDRNRNNLWEDSSSIFIKIMSKIFGINNEAEDNMKIEKLEKDQEKILEIIEKKLMSENISSEELYDYSQIINCLKSSEEYKNIMKSGFGGFNGSNCLPPNKDLN